MAACGLSYLSVRLLKAGALPERIAPGKLWFYPTIVASIVPKP